MDTVEFLIGLGDALTFQAEADRLRRLACPTEDAEPSFTRHMQEAERLGMTWLEALRYAAEQRRSSGN